MRHLPILGEDPPRLVAKKNGTESILENLVSPSPLLVIVGINQIALARLLGQGSDDMAGALVRRGVVTQKGTG